VAKVGLWVEFERRQNGFCLVNFFPANFFFSKNSHFQNTKKVLAGKKINLVLERISENWRYSKKDLETVNKFVPQIGRPCTKNWEVQQT
jgi:hypothetical protein